jgi:hypothetical protein
VQVLGAIEVAGVVVGHVHVLQLLGCHDLLLEQGANEAVGEAGQRLFDGRRQLEVDDCDFLALGVLVEPGEVVDAAEFEGELEEDAADFLLEGGEEGGQALAGGVVPEDEFEEGEVGQFVAVLPQQLGRSEVRVCM